MATKKPQVIDQWTDRYQKTYRIVAANQSELVVETLCTDAMGQACWSSGDACHLKLAALATRLAYIRASLVEAADKNILVASFLGQLHRR